MLHVQHEPLSDPDKEQLRAFLDHPGCVIYRRWLRSQAAEKMAQSATKLVDSQGDKDDSAAVDAQTLSTEARVIMAGEKALEQVTNDKEAQFSLVVIRPEP